MAQTDLSKYVVNVQGKDFITFPGLLAEAHAQGLKEVRTELVNTDLKTPVVKATVVIGDKTFTGYGDASVDNVGRMVAKALLRMAETRAIARALRFACNIDMTALEELDPDATAASPEAPKKVSGFTKPKPQLVGNGTATPASDGDLWT